MIIWYREVLSPLEDHCLLSNKSILMFKKYMIKELNKTFETNNINCKLKFKDSPSKEFMEDVEVNFSLEENINNIYCLSEGLNHSSANKLLVGNLLPISMSTNNSTYSTQNSFTQPNSFNKEKNVINEEFTSLEFQNEFFIEQYYMVINKGLS